MKITYERLNQIIEEEVVKFKRLNEATSIITNIPTDLSDINGAANYIKSVLNPPPSATPYKSVKELKDALSAAVAKLPG